ncbi:ferritin-like metal-binding protein YciE [Variovorax paradoxus]|uniref:YciE/YciF ferroxidase family protein n=1 Tax=Variovorax paradoxus TaxID=34073 RepID=UPI00278DA8CC|nr:ferritin-like domain-containing protein [Variovorax paradoxus]MDQ0571115.1 ferritin-like metal-binding protein YciE [Variovorax paradoxus]
MPIKSLSDLFVHELSDTYSAEKQMTRSLSKLARAATDEGLASAFETHLEETRGQVERIEEIAELLQIKIKRIKCDGMAGLVEEGDSLIDEIEKGPVLDAALIGAARKVEHYEIAGYNSLCTLAKQLGHTEAVALLEASLAEETATDGKLSALAEAHAMEEAVAAE